MRTHRILAAFIALTVACDASVSLNREGHLSSQSQSLSQGFAPGSYIIPMDTTYQNSTMLTAYGLVEALLTQGIPIYWAIEPGKAVNGTDFTASATSLANGATITSYNYSGGPFVVSSVNAAAALPIITAWNTPTLRAVVHQATSTFTAYIQEEIVAAPRVAIDADGYENLAFNYLNGAGIPDSNGNTWPTAVLSSYSSYPDVVTPTQVGTGVLLNTDGTPVYTNLTSMHFTGTPTAATVQAVRNWLAAGPLTLAVMECLAVTAFENAATYGDFLTTGGLTATSEPANATIEVPDTPLNQVYVPSGTTLTTTSGAVDSFQLASGSALQSGVQYLAAGTSPATEVIWMSGHMAGNPNYGVLAYLAGHDYGGGASSPPLPITSNPLTNGVRLYLDAFLQTAAIQSAYQPVIAVTVSSPAVNAAGSITWTINYSNTGVGYAQSATLTDTLPSGVTFSSASNSGTNSGGTVTWSLGNLKSGASGSVTVTGTVSADGTYSNSASMAWVIGRTHFQQASNVAQNSFPSTLITSGPASQTNAPTATFTFTSNTAGATFSCSLDSAAYAACPTPQTYSGLSSASHKLSVVSIAPGGNTDLTPATWSWTVSTTTPKTTITSKPTNPTNVSVPVFAFSSTESPATFQCELDGASSFTTCPSTFPSLSDGSHTLIVRAVDAYGNVDPAPPSYTWVIDTQKPKTTIATFPTNPSNQTTAAFTLTSSEAGSTFQCGIDGSAFASCTSSPSYSGLTAASHTFIARATDAAGNVDPNPPSYTWTISLAKPVTTIVSGPANPTNQTSATFTFSASQSPVTYQCKVDSASFSACTDPVTFSGLAAGSHTLTVEAMDAAGNTDATPPTYTWVIDLTPPVVTIVSGPPAKTSSTSAAFTLSANKAVATYLCSLDGATYTDCTSSVSYSALVNGTHQLLASAIDKAGNTAVTPASYSWSIGTTPPVTTIVSGPANPTNQTTATFVVSSSETPVTFECALDTASFSPCPEPLTFAGLAPGSHTLTVESVDAYGNSDTNPPSYTWVIDTTAPVVTITSGPPSQTNATTATFALSASEVVTTYLCSLDGAAFTDCSASPSLTGLTNGAHTFQAGAIDAAGNTAQPPASYSWTVNTTPPVTTIVTGPPAQTNSTTATFTFGANESPVTYLCELDGATTFTPCPSSFTNLSDGTHTLTVEAVDAYGNADPNPPTYTWTVNTVAPMVGITTGPATYSNSNSATFTFTSNQTGTTYQCSLDGAAFAPCTSNPTFSNLPNGPQTLLVIGTDPAGNQTPPSSYTWTVGTTAPMTTIVTHPAVITNQTTAAFTFASSENPATYQCEIDSATSFTQCVTPDLINGLADGSHTITVASIDQFGNVDPNPPSFTWTINTVAPVVTITSGPNLVTNSTSAQFQLTASEMLSTFLCGLDGAALTACSSTPSYTGLKSGMHTLLASGIDNAGNTAQTPASYVWTIGTAPPSTTIVSSPPNPSTSSTAVFVFGSNETPVTYQCELDSATSFTACPATFTALAYGSHTLTVRAVDMFGNVDPNPPSYTWVVDTTPPDTTIVTGPTELTNSTTATFTFSSDKSPVTFQCQLDSSGTFATCPTPDEIDNLTDGVHVLQVRAVDSAGLTDPSPAVATWTVDTTPPTTTIVTEPPAVDTASTATFSFSSDKSPVTYQCLVDSGSFTECPNPTTLNGLAQGSHTLSVRAVDAAGNVDPNPPSYGWIVDDNPPTTSIGTETASDGSPDPSGFSSDKSPVTYQCELDGAAEWTPCPTTFVGLAPGTHTLKVRAVDQYGVPDPNPPSTSWTVRQNVQLQGASLGCSSSGVEPWGFALLLAVLVLRRRPLRCVRTTG